MAVLAEALHTLSDIVVSAFLLAAAIWSRRAADAERVCGHGRAQNVVALVGTLFAWGWPIADPLAAIVVATIITYNGIGSFVRIYPS